MPKIDGSQSISICKREFVRETRRALGERVELPLGWFAIFWRFFDERPERRRQHGRVWRISCGDCSIFRILRFSANLRSAEGECAEIAIDYLGWLDLCNREENVNGCRSLNLQPAAWYEFFFFAFKHPDLSYRLATWIATLSLFLGIISIILAVIPFMK